MLKLGNQPTPWKINMKLENDGLVKMMFLSQLGQLGDF